MCVGGGGGARPRVCLIVSDKQDIYSEINDRHDYGTAITLRMQTQLPSILRSAQNTSKPPRKKPRALNSHPSCEHSASLAPGDETRTGQAGYVATPWLSPHRPTGIIYSIRPSVPLGRPLSTRTPLRPGTGQPTILVNVNLKWQSQSVAKGAGWV